MDKRSFLFVIALTVGLFFVNQWFAPTPTHKPPSDIITQTSPSTSAAPVSTSSSTALSYSSDHEEFFVIQNNYQQVVFSNRGGAIAEINLPFPSSENTQSIVLPTGIDRLFHEEYPTNDLFPAFSYSINQGNGIKKVDARSEGGYYPLLRRTLFAPNGTAQPPHRYYALRVTADGQDLDKQLFRLKRLETDLIEFELSTAGRRITKTFSFPKEGTDAPYCLDVSIAVDGQTQGLWLTSGVPEVELISDSAAPALSYKITKSNQRTSVESLSLPKECTTATTLYPNWVCTANGFFGLIVDPLSEMGLGYRACKIPGTQDPSRLSLIDPAYTPYPAEDYPGYEFQLPLLSEMTQLRYYAGPLQADMLKRVDAAYTTSTPGSDPQYSLALSFHGWFTFISEPFAKFLFILMNFFHMVTRSWGVSIILLTVALRVMLYPLNAWSIKSTVKMQEIAPKVSALQEKYKKDPKRAQAEVLSLYKQQGVNPLSGCFPMLIQLPFLIGMFDLLKSSFELRGVPFIPGWINNLTAPDVLFSWSYPVLFFGNQFHLLPFLLGAVMWLQQRFSGSSQKNPKLMTDQQKQQRAMGNIMTIVFTVMFYHFPSGLNLYWLSSMALGILQQWWMSRKIAKS